MSTLELEDKEYTAEDVAKILRLEPARVAALLKDAGAKEKGDDYVATKEQVATILNRPIYTVEDVEKTLKLGRSRVTDLLKNAGAKKIGNKYFATREQVVAVSNRPNQTFKLHNIERML